MKLALTGYRLHDKKRKDQRTLIAFSGHPSTEAEFRERLRKGEITGEPVKGRLTPQYARSK